MPTTHASFSPTHTSETRGLWATIMAFLDSRARAEAKSQSYVPFGL